MKKKPVKRDDRSVKKPTRRKNISLHPDVQSILKELADSEYTTASAMLTQMILERQRMREEKAKAGIKPLPSLPGESEAVAS